MHRYLVERELLGAGNLSAEQLQDVSQNSNEVLRDMGPGVQWVLSYLTADRLYCVYLAENETLVREHAKRGGFPCTKITEVLRVIDPMTAMLQTT